MQEASNLPLYKLPQLSTSYQESWTHELRERTHLGTSGWQKERQGPH